MDINYHLLIDIVLVGENDNTKVLKVVGGVKDPDALKLLLFAYFDTCEIHSVNTVEIKQIVNCRKG